MHQLLANRGYAVLQRQLPGLDRLRQEVPQRRQPPVGQGHARRPARRRRLGGQRRASPPKDKVASCGGSYGGYATLVGLAMTPEVFALRRRHRRPVEPHDAARLDPAVLGADRSRCSTRGWATRARRRARRCSRPRSPLTHADEHQASAADRPGRQRPARQAGRVRADRRGDEGSTACRSPTSLFPDEGHGFARPENNIAFFAIDRGVPVGAPRRLLPADLPRPSSTPPRCRSRTASAASPAFWTDRRGRRRPAGARPTARAQEPSKNRTALGRSACRRGRRLRLSGGRSSLEDSGLSRRARR